MEANTNQIKTTFLPLFLSLFSFSLCLPVCDSLFHSHRFFISPPGKFAGVTTMLNFFTTSNGFRSTLPVVSNLTAMNVWDGVCMCFIYASLLEFVCVNYVGRKRPLHNVVYRPGENPVTQVKSCCILLFCFSLSCSRLFYFCFGNVSMLLLYYKKKKTIFFILVSASAMRILFVHSHFQIIMQHMLSKVLLLFNFCREHSFTFSDKWILLYIMVNENERKKKKTKYIW